LDKVQQARFRNRSNATYEDEKVCKDPSDLLKGIGDMFVNSELGVNYAKGNKVNWSMLSNSILNKFAPGHAVFKQQLNKMKYGQEDYLKKLQQNSDIADCRRCTMKYDSSKNMNEVQKLMQKKLEQRERLYSDQPDLKKWAELKDQYDLSKLQIDLIVNGVTLDKNGNLIRKKKSRSIASKNPYRKIKSKFKEQIDILSRKNASMRKESGKTFKINSNSSEIGKNLNIVREKIMNKRKRFYTEGDNSYLLNIIHKSHQVDTMPSFKAKLKTQKTVDSDSNIYYSNNYKMNDTLKQPDEYLEEKQGNSVESTNRSMNLNNEFRSTTAKRIQSEDKIIYTPQKKSSKILRKLSRKIYRRDSLYKSMRKVRGGINRINETVTEPTFSSSVRIRDIKE